MIKFLCLLGVLLGVAAVLWVLLLPALVVSTIRSRTGFETKIDSLSVNPFTAKVSITGLVLKNPGNWPEGNLVELREFRFDGDVYSVLSDRYVANEVVLDVAKVELVRNQQGILNTAAFQEGIAGPQTAGEAGPKGGGRKGFLIRHLVLKVDKLVYADYSGRRPVIKEYDVKVSRDLTDVDSLAKIVSPLTGSALGLVSNALAGMFKGQPDLLKDTAVLIQDAGKKTGEKIKGLLDSLDKKKP